MGRATDTASCRSQRAAPTVIGPTPAPFLPHLSMSEGHASPAEYSAPAETSVHHFSLHILGVASVHDTLTNSNNSAGWAGRESWACRRGRFGRYITSTRVRSLGSSCTRVDGFYHWCEGLHRRQMDSPAVQRKVWRSLHAMCAPWHAGFPTPLPRRWLQTSVHTARWIPRGCGTALSYRPGY